MEQRSKTCFASCGRGSQDGVLPATITRGKPIVKRRMLCDFPVGDVRESVYGFFPSQPPSSLSLLICRNEQNSFFEHSFFENFFNLLVLRACRVKKLNQKKPLCSEPGRHLLPGKYKGLNAKTTSTTKPSIAKILVNSLNLACYS